MVSTVDDRSAFYIHLTATEQSALQAIEGGVVDYVKNRLGSSCRPIWASLNDHGHRIVRLSAADICPVIAFSIGSTELTNLSDDTLLHLIETCGPEEASEAERDAQ